MKDRTPDFEGWATKANLLCSDGRTIAPEAFQHQDALTVPLVWQHDHKNVENVLGHVELSVRDEGVWARGFFNDSDAAVHAHKALLHGDLKQMSIWANQLMERGKRVLHGVIREVSLVLSGANPGANIEAVAIRHSDDEMEDLLDTAVITSGEDVVLAHSSEESSDDESQDEDTEEVVEHGEDGERSVADIIDTMNEEQTGALAYLVAQAMSHDSSADEGDVEHDDTDSDDDSDTGDDTGEVEHDDTQEGDNEMKHNVFDKTDEIDAPKGAVLSHADVDSIISSAQRSGSFRSAVEGYAIAHGIEDIDVLFPDAQATGTPEWDSRRMEWVDDVLAGVTKRPFSRIKTRSADITGDEARARGYITGNMKVEEWFKVKARVTTPTTVYKKQKLDRDDIVDITDFDIVVWLKAEMRVMLDEELARAILIGDGREAGDDDKIDDDHIRPIAYDDEAYTTTVNVNLGDANSTIQEVIDALVLNRKYLKGSGQPTMYTTETYIAQFLLLKDTTGRRIYKNLEELALELRVAKIVPVEAMEQHPDLVCVLVNLVDYHVGADKGGQVSMFDDFDIDYNQNKYLIETRVSGALTRLKSAMVVVSVPSTDVLAVPEAPTFDEGTGVVTIPTVTGVQYEDSTAPGVALSAGAQSALAAGESITVVAVPTSGYYFATSENDEWTFTRPSA